MKTEVGIWTVYLVDDGTLDTVLECRMRVAEHIRYTCRFDAKYVLDNECRDVNGWMLDDGFNLLAREAADYADEQHAITKELQL